MKDKIIGLILCNVFNYHQWQYILKQENGICEPLTDKIPSRAVCKRCGATYGIDY